MSLFRRVLRGFFWLLGFVLAIVGAVAVFFARRLISPPRQPLWATPADLGLDYQEIQFPAQDGVRLSGWFIPGQGGAVRQGATIVLVHGWPWNRLGASASDLLSNLSGSTPVDLLRLAFALRHEGYNVFMFDLRNHGESAAVPPVTFGWQEANDLLGALAYVNTRADVDNNRVGVIGFSMGANAVLYALPQTEQIKAAVAVQPTSADVFARRYGYQMIGVLSKLVVPLTELLYQAAGGLRFTALQPAFAAAGAGQTPVLYVQGKGDRWGSLEDVARMAAATPQAQSPLFVDSAHRFGGYQYVIDNPKIVSAFFEQHLPE